MLTAPSADDLTMSSTTDTPEQIRDGLGLPAVEAPAADADESGAGEAAGTEETQAPPPVAAETAEPVTDATAVAEPVKAEAAAAARRRDGKGKFTASPEQAKLDRVAAAARRDAEAARAVLEAEVKALRQRLDQTLAPPPVADGGVVAKDPSVEADYRAKIAALGTKPKQEDFEDYADYEAKRDAWIEDRAVLRAQEALAHEGAARRAGLARQDAIRAGETVRGAYERSVAATAARHADYQEVVQRADAAKLIALPHVRDAVLNSGESTSGELGYYLMKNPDRLHALNAMSPAAATFELGRLAATLDPSATTAARRVVKPVSRAPEPQGTELGALPSANTDDLEHVTSQAEYNRIRDRQQRGRNGRRY